MVDDVYGSQVADIIAAQPRSSTYVPAEPMELFVRNRRQPTVLAELEEIERSQLARIGTGFDRALEVAVIVDASGTPIYRLWGRDYGSIYLMAANRLECVAYASQHDVEQWRLEQRPIFWAMDRALRRADHAFRQPVRFNWWDEWRWEELVDYEPGQVRSEPFIREQFA